MAEIIPFKPKSSEEPHPSYNLPETAAVLVKHADFYLQAIKSGASIEFTDPLYTIAELLNEIRDALNADNWGV